MDFSYATVACSIYSGAPIPEFAVSKALQTRAFRRYLDAFMETVDGIERTKTVFVNDRRGYCMSVPMGPRRKWITTTDMARGCVVYPNDHRGYITSVPTRHRWSMTDMVRGCAGVAMDDHIARAVVDTVPRLAVLLRRARQHPELADLHGALSARVARWMRFLEFNDYEGVPRLVDRAVLATLGDLCFSNGRYDAELKWRHVEDYVNLYETEMVASDVSVVAERVPDVNVHLWIRCDEIFQDILDGHDSPCETLRFANTALFYLLRL